MQDTAVRNGSMNGNILKADPSKLKPKYFCSYVPPCTGAGDAIVRLFAEEREFLFKRIFSLFCGKSIDCDVGGGGDRLIHCARWMTKRRKGRKNANRINNNISPSLVLRRGRKERGDILGSEDYLRSNIAFWVAVVESGGGVIEATFGDLIFERKLLHTDMQSYTGMEMHLK